VCVECLFLRSVTEEKGRGWGEREREKGRERERDLIIEEHTDTAASSHGSDFNVGSVVDV
jgi:hypothetical protein